MAQPSSIADALNSGIPLECATANTITDGVLLDYPGIAGTGFFARRDRKIFYFTALHCVRCGPASLRPTLASLLIPIRHTGHSTSADDFIEFGDTYRLEQYLDGQWHDSIDLLVCEVRPPRRPQDFQHLLTRSAKLPRSAKWLQEFLASPTGLALAAERSLAGVIIGFPRSSPLCNIDYGEPGAETFIQTEAVVIPALVGFSDQPDFLSVEPIDCPYEFSGLSGSPVFAKVASSNGPQYALIGMVICGSSTTLNALRLEMLLEAAPGDA